MPCAANQVNDFTATQPTCVCAAGYVGYPSYDTTAKTWSDACVGMRRVGVRVCVDACVCVRGFM